METLHSILPFIGSPSTDLVTNLFESANKVTDYAQERLTEFYLSNPRTLLAIIVCTLYFLYYLRNVVQVNALSYTTNPFSFLNPSFCR